VTNHLPESEQGNPAAKERYADPLECLRSDAVEKRIDASQASLRARTSPPRASALVKVRPMLPLSPGQQSSG
jgi:hypothetical protein